MKVSELRALLGRARSDVSVLEELAKELTFRNAPTAKELADELMNALASLKGARVRATGTSARPVSSVATSKVSSGAHVLPFPEGPEPRHPVQPRPRKPTEKPDAPAQPAVPPIEDLGRLPTFASPKDPNEPRAILAAWTALEALYPQTYRKPEDLAAGDRRCVTDLTKELPWIKGERSRPEKKLYYHVILGAIAMDRATGALIAAFGEDEERSRREKEKAAIAAVMVDKNGCVLDENALAVSSFAWALPHALKLELGGLGAWLRVEQTLQDRLGKILRRKDPDGKPLPP